MSALERLVRDDLMNRSRRAVRRALHKFPGSARNAFDADSLTTDVAMRFAWEWEEDGCPTPPDYWKLATVARDCVIQAWRRVKSEERRRKRWIEENLRRGEPANEPEVILDRKTGLTASLEQVRTLLPQLEAPEAAVLTYRLEHPDADAAEMCEALRLSRATLYRRIQSSRERITDLLAIEAEKCQLDAAYDRFRRAPDFESAERFIRGLPRGWETSGRVMATVQFNLPWAERVGRSREDVIRAHTAAEQFSKFYLNEALRFAREGRNRIDEAWTRCMIGSLHVGKVWREGQGTEIAVRQYIQGIELLCQATRGEGLEHLATQKVDSQSAAVMIEQNFLPWVEEWLSYECADVRQCAKAMLVEARDLFLRLGYESGTAWADQISTTSL